ncbi:5'-nucleotidase SurE [Vitis vinifera]|uniref:5'-nucleotidase SurE n=1 Tax=Vitis vinifera TaxID=29760 RepID=A0A438K7B6_VITVI|nr:5'-nucleotidase SurE [Vitis vinifera]
MTTSVKNNFLPPGLVSNLQEVLLNRKGGSENDPSKSNDESTQPSSSDAVEANSDTECSKPVVLVTNADGIEAPGLNFLVEALVRDGLCNVHVCAPQSDKSVSGHSVTLRETVAVTSAEINGATAYEVSGTPVDCVSLALSGALFSWSKPLLVISGINRGSSCGHHMFYSGVVAGAREALFCGVPSMSISLNWKKDESQESDFKDAVTVCLPLINAAIRDIEKGVFPKSCLLNIEIPASPLTNKDLCVEMRMCCYAMEKEEGEGKRNGSTVSIDQLVDGVQLLTEAHQTPILLQTIGFGNMILYDLGVTLLPLLEVIDEGLVKNNSCGFKLTKQSLWRSTPSWQAVSTNRHPAGFMSNQQSLGIQLAQLSRDASAAGAARRLTTQRKNVEIVESVGVAGKTDFNRVKKYFRLEVRKDVTAKDSSYSLLSALLFVSCRLILAVLSTDELTFGHGARIYLQFVDKEQEGLDEDLDFRALENGFVAVTPLSLSQHNESDIHTTASEWMNAALQHGEQ